MSHQSDLDGRRADLEVLGTATVAESGGRPLSPGLSSVWNGAKLAGPVVPVRCGQGDNLAIHRAVAMAETGTVLVVAIDGDHERGFWGEVLTVAAQHRGMVGLVIDGHVRDVEALERRGFPAWARGTALAGATKDDPGQIGEPIVLRGALVEAGDWVVADVDGVAIVPGGQFDAVIEAGRARAERERLLFIDLQAGRTTLELLGLEPP